MAGIFEIDLIDATYCDGILWNFHRKEVVLHAVKDL